MLLLKMILKVMEIFTMANRKIILMVKKTPKRYRNKFLAEAMKTLKMGVDVSGRGINLFIKNN